MYVGDLSRGRMVHRLEHLSCFLGGLLTLGAEVIPPSTPIPASHPLSMTSDTLQLSEHERQLHRWVGAGLTRTCTLTYLDQKSGLGPEEVVMGASGARRFVDVVDNWQDQNRVGTKGWLDAHKGGFGLPGVDWNVGSKDVGDSETRDVGEDNEDGRVGVAKDRDYFHNSWTNSYQLRPEVRSGGSCRLMFSLLIFFPCRRLRVSSTCTARQVILNGVKGVTRYFKPSRSMRRRSTGIRASEV